MITVELVGGPADGARYTQIDFRPVLPTPPAFGSQNGVYRLRQGQVTRLSAGIGIHNPMTPLFYDYQPPMKAGCA